VTAADAGVVVDLGRALGHVQPEIYGQFMSRRRWVVEDALHQPSHPDADEFGNRTTVVEAVRELAPPVIRWPGGCTGTSYEWEYGIGPVEQRSRTIDWHFGYDVSNDFGTAEFVRYCRDVGAEPQINLTTGTGTLREALNWLEYCNSRHDSHYANLRRSHGYEEPFNVQYWQIGNEDWGEWEIGRVPAAEHARRCREFGRALHKLDPRVTVLAAGAWRPDIALDWNLPLLREAWNDLDYLCVHTYWRFDPTRRDGDYDRLIGVTDREEGAIVALRGVIDAVAREKSATRTPKLAFTEWNAANLTRKEMSAQWRPSESQYRMVDAVVCAAFLNVLQRQSDTVGLANFAQTINVVGALVVSQDSVVRESVYWPLWMQRHHSGSIAVDAQISSPDVYCESWSGEPASTAALDISATRDPEATRLWLSIVNRDKDDAHSLEISVSGSRTLGTARRCELRAPSPLSMNTVAEPDIIAPAWSSVDLGNDPVVSVPPCSYTILEVLLP
jgi:alpha-N-arabinofuranosidase